MPTKRPKPLASDLTLTRIRVHQDGYDAAGAYWGEGPDVFIGTTADGTIDYTVRARTVAEARIKIEAERTREVGVPPSDDPRGGQPPTQSRYALQWRDAAAAVTVRIKITHSRDYLSQGQDHIEIESIEPKKAALPITETGYRSHFIAPLELINAGGPVTFVTAWLNTEAAKPAWRKRQTQKAQGDLFQWAAATPSNAPPKRPKRKATSPSKRAPNGPS